MYECLEGGVIAVLQSYIDEDVSKDESRPVVILSNAFVYLFILLLMYQMVVLFLKLFCENL